MPEFIVAITLKTVENLNVISSKTTEKGFRKELIVLYDLLHLNEGYKDILNISDTYSEIIGHSH